MGNTFEDFVKGFILTELDKAEGLETYGCDLGYELYRLGEDDLPKGKDVCMRIITFWADESGEFLELGLDKLPATRVELNPFLRPEEFVHAMIEEWTDAIATKTTFSKENWDDMRVLTVEDIAMIKDDIRKITREDF